MKNINLINKQVITTPVYWYSATQAETVIPYPEGKRIGEVIVTFSHDCTVTTYNTEVILTDEIDQYYSGIPASSKRNTRRNS